MNVRRVSAYGAAWLAATAAGIALSWFGLRDVVNQAALGPVNPIAPNHSPVTLVPPTSTPPEPSPLGSPPTTTTTQRSRTSTGEAAPSTPGGPTTSSAAATSRSTPSGTAPPGTTQPSTAPTNVRYFDVTGGRTAIAFDENSAGLVSATPEPGYRVRTWNNTGWLRVRFTNGEQATSVIVTWHTGPPTVRIVHS